MGLHWDGTITLGDILMMLSFAFSALLVYGKIATLLAILKEFPLHRHDGAAIYYPHGMKPEDPQRG